MERMLRLGSLAVAGVALLLAGSVGYAQAPVPKYTNAEVVKVRTQERLLVIKNADGVEQTLQLDDHVAGIGDLRPGDRVILTLRGEPGRARVESFSKSEASSKSAASQTRAVAQPARERAIVEDTGDETAAEAAFEARVSALSQQSARVDTLWTSFRTSCNVILRGGAAYDGARPWLSLWDGTAQVDLSSGNCRDMYNQIVGLGQAVNESMAGAEDVAGRVLAPGRIREIERRHSLDWGGWGRGAPELRDHR
jgi:hypothetical protein